MVARARRGDPPLADDQSRIAGRKLCSCRRATPRDKTAAYERIYWLLRARPEAELLEASAISRRRTGVASEGLARRSLHGLERACGAKPPSARPSARTASPIGALRIARRPRSLTEMAGSKATLEARLGSKGRAISLIRSETRPARAGASSSLPRARLRDGGHTRARYAVFRARRALDRVAPRFRQRPLARCRALEILLTGAPFWLWNRGRLIAAA